MISNWIYAFGMAAGLMAAISIVVIFMLTYGLKFVLVLLVFVFLWVGIKLILDQVDKRHE